MATPRGRLLQLLCARVRRASALAPRAAPRLARAVATGGAGVSPGAGAASAIEASFRAAASSSSPSSSSSSSFETIGSSSGGGSSGLGGGNSGGNNDDNDFPSSTPPPPPASAAAASADAAAAAWLYRRFRQRGGADLAFDVVQFFPDGTALEHHRPLTPAELELHPRDVGLFAPSPRLAAPQRATIAVHDAKILFRTEAARAIITADRAVLFKPSRRRGESSRMARAVLSALQAAPPGAAAGAEAPAPSSVPPPLPFGLVAQSAGAAHAAARQAAAQQAAAASALPQLPFELRVLEVLLDATADYFYRKAQHLNWMLEAVGGDEGASLSSQSSPSSLSASASASATSAAGNGANGAGLGSEDGLGSEELSGGSSSSGHGAMGTGPMAALARAEPFAAMDKAHQLVPVQRFLVAVKADVQETAKAIEALIEDPESLEELCLTHRRERALAGALPPAPGRGAGAARGLQQQQQRGGAGSAAALSLSLDVKLANNMLESYLREIQSIEGALKETEENLENTRQGWQIALDASRNHIIQVNMWLSLVSISVMAATLVPAALGMNLSSGLDGDDPATFLAVCAASLAVAGLSFPLGRALYLRHWRKVAHQELFEQKMLRVLLMQHADELDDVVAALGAAHRAGHPLDRARFRKILSETLGSRALGGGKADFLWNLFDTDRSGFLSEAEVLRRVSSSDDARGMGAGAAAHLPEGGGGAGGGGALGDAALAAGASATVRRPPPRVARGAGA